jgi:hypothetical protein
MPHGRAENLLAVRTYQVGHILGFLYRWVSLKRFKLGWSEDAIEITAKQVSGTVFLVPEHKRLAGGAGDVEHPCLAASLPQVLILFHSYLLYDKGLETVFVSVHTLAHLLY